MNYCWRKVAVFISIKKSCFKENIHYRILKNNLNALGLHNLSFLIILLNLKTKNHGIYQGIQRLCHARQSC